MEVIKTTLDLLYLAFIAALLLVDHFVLWPTFLRRSQADSSRARLWLWSAIALHALVDIGSGVIAWLALRQVQGGAATAPA